jgi:hypothetical protein
VAAESGQRGPAGRGRGAGVPMADADGGRRQAKQIDLPGREPDVAGGGPSLADADRDRQPQPGRRIQPQRGRAGHRRPTLADPDRSRRRRRRRPGSGWPLGWGPQPAHRDGDGPPAQPGLGRGPDGLPARLDPATSGLESSPPSGQARQDDRAGWWGWPAPPGRPPHAWEPPRTTGREPFRAQRLTGLGNVVVPQVAEVVGRWALTAWHALDPLERPDHTTPIFEEATE